MGLAQTREQLNAVAHEAKAARTERDIAVSAARRAVDNDVSEGLLRSRLIDALPRIADKLPRPTELRTIAIGGDDGGGLVQPLISLLTSVQSVLKETGQEE